MSDRAIGRGILDALGGLPLSRGLSPVIGLTAVVFSALYFVSDLIELAQGGFSTVQLALTLPAEAAIPFFIVGLYVVQRPRIGTVGLVGTVVYAYTFVFFTGTVVFALVNRTSSWDALVDQVGLWMTIHGLLMVLGGLAFGLAVVRAGVLPRWTGVTLMAGVVLIAASSGLPNIVQTASAGVRDFAFAAMGASLLVTGRRARRRNHSRDLAQADALSARPVSVPAPSSR